MTTAKELINSTYKYETVKINGLDVQIRSLSASETIKFSNLIENKTPNIVVAAFLVKHCCKSFDSWVWPVWRVKRKLPLKLLTEISNKIMEISGYGPNAVDDAVKE